MRLNEYEISSVSDTASSAVQKIEKTKKKSSINTILALIKSLSSAYVLISYNDRKPSVNLSLNLNISTFYDFFSLFLSSKMLIIILNHTNIKEEDMTSHFTSLAEDTKTQSKKRS